MRFIGSKTLLLPHIKEVIEENIKHSVDTFCDIFSGTGSVARYFKKDYCVISNDLLHFSYVLQRATIENNKIPNFAKLTEIGISNPFDVLNTNKVSLKDLNQKAFIFENYSPTETNDRKYLTNENALKVDFSRQTIENWKNQNLINLNEYYFLLASLLEAVPFVSNIAGTYGAYLKHWDKRAYKKITLENMFVLNNGKKNRSYNENSNSLVKQIEGDILYVDPPYNTRQYLPNYHLLETISKYDNPPIYGKTGLRSYDEVRSRYCMKTEVHNEFTNLIKNAKFNYIIVSYSSEGLMSEGDIKNILVENGIRNTYRIKRIPYRRYKHIKKTVEHRLEELIFFIQKR